MKRVYYLLVVIVALLCLIIPDAVLASGRRSDIFLFITCNSEAGWSFSKFWIHQYNTSPYMFGLWCTISVAGLGVVLGFITDQLMKLTGLDLTSRDIIEH